MEVLEELVVGTSAALLLPVHTIKDSEMLLTYPALPAGKSLYFIIIEYFKKCGFITIGKIIVCTYLCLPHMFRFSNLLLILGTSHLY